MRTHIPALLLGLLLLTRAHAAPPSAPAPPWPTLAQALATAHTPTEGVTLAVGADKTLLPDGATLPPPGASPADCAAAFGLTAQPFGAVTALAPATMTLLNDQPGDPDLSVDMNPYEAFQELAASLSDAQWKALISEGGLGLSDLSDDSQRALFWTQFPRKTLKIAPAPPSGKAPDPASATDVSNGLGQAHLRLGQTARLYPPKRSGDGHLYGVPMPDPVGAAPWVVVREKQPPRTHQYGIAVRAEVPNAPKPGDLVFDQSILQAPIPLAGLKTVGDLITRVGRATGLELYAERHYEGRALAVFGPAPTAPASDLLRALALCVTGTFRRVGPAYVLTDGLTGIGAVRQIWSEFNDRVIALRQKPNDEAERTLFNRRSAFDLSAFGDPVAATKEQETSDPDTSMGHFFPQVPPFTDAFAFAALTPSQQEAARQMVARYSAEHAADIAKDPTEAPDLSGKWMVTPQYVLQVMLPGITQPIELRKTSLETLVFPPEDVIQPMMKQMEAWDKAQEAKKQTAKPMPQLASLLARTPRRAVLADPRSPAEVRTLVTTMQKLGLNQLWLYVFEDGLARVPGTPMAQPLDAKDDLLDAALAATQGTGITVFPTMDLLTWGQSPPPAVRDVNILGETSVQIDARQKTQSYQDPDDKTPPDGMSVSPFAPEVWADLAALVKNIAARPNIGGMVWRTTEIDTDDLNTGLGYTPAARLAFLRRAHADPLDITADDYSNLDFRLPNWDDAKAEAKLRDEWQAFRTDTDLTLLRSLYAASRSAAAPLPVFIDARQGGDWFGTWDDAHAAPPASPNSGETGYDLPELAQAKSQSRLSLTAITLQADADADDLARLLDARLNGAQGKAWDGFVLDIATGDGGPGVTGFAQLARGVTSSDRRRSP